MIAIVSVVAGVVTPVFLSRTSAKNAKIQVLETKVETQEAIIMELTLQNQKMEITGTLLNRFFNQLPTNSELRKETIE